ncbi:MAG: polyamine aminopropyltransferase [Candidatus Contendobacter sp.]|jgi:spermidine synthase|nr:polyamine aminopropyltransferase [Gammaproteobacteria bacterium]MCC8993796.1 polyamine aminopropyltransferase [Candidatus Contendobacter sp.]
MTYALLFSVFVIASCGLVYELIAGALASYLLGDSVTQFSTVIGTYLFAMGIGSWLSRYIVRGLVARFIQIEVAVGILGGFSAPALFLIFAWAGAFRPALYGLVLIIGILVGLEIPLVMRILKQQFVFKDLVAQVLTFDYLGALVVSLLFPILLAPHLGLIRTSLLFGLLNVLVAAWALWLFRDQLPQGRWLQGQCLVAMLALVAGFVAADRITELAEENLYTDEIVLARTTPYQRIVLTRWKDDLRLFLNNNLQFSSRDEYRYHEALVHPGLSATPGARRALVLGGGDGLAVREMFRYDSLESITLVDLDPEMTRLFAEHPLLTPLNNNALNSPKLRIINADALRWLEENPGQFDFIVVDFPDPTNYSLGKLYSTVFYRLLEKHLAAQGAAVVQTTSPLYARQSFWCIVRTLESVGLTVTPYHAYVPAFGEWGFTLATRQPWQAPDHYPPGLRFLTTETTPALFQFPPDMGPVDAEINRLNNQILVRYYEQEWRQVTQ